jgi:predicted dehydrogenase
MKVGVIGAGSIAREFSLRYLTDEEGMLVVAIVDVNIEAARLLAEDVSLRRAGAPLTGTKYRETVDKSDFIFDSSPHVHFATDMAEILSFVDCVYIATPPSTHASLTTLALEAKKHVILEKPLAVSEEDCYTIVNAAEAAHLSGGLVVNVNIGMRFNAALIELRRLIREPSFGDVIRIDLNLLFLQWPREWQKQPWVGLRAEVSELGCVSWLILA